MNQRLPKEMERLTSLLVDELEKYEQIRKLTEKQSQMLIKDDIEAFNDSLDKRAELIEEIKGLHQESDPLMRSYVSFTAKGNKADSDIDELNKKIGEALEMCSDLNEKNIAAMMAKTEEHTKKIDEKSAKRKGIGGYAQAVPNTPEMFDKKT